jgi:CheY-like chemotaxis protein
MMNILLVEDEQALRDTTAAALALCGHTVVPACDGIEGLARVHEAPPDLVLLDLQMPEMDGWEFLRQFRPIPGCGNVPVIVMTAAHRVVADELDAQAIFVKPFDLDELLEVVDELLAARAAADSDTRARPRNVRAYAQE